MREGGTNGQTDGGDCNIPDAFLKRRGDNEHVENLVFDSCDPVICGVA